MSRREVFRLSAEGLRATLKLWAETNSDDDTSDNELKEERKLASASGLLVGLRRVQFLAKHFSSPVPYCLRGFTQLAASSDLHRNESDCLPPSGFLQPGDCVAYQCRLRKDRNSQLQGDHEPDARDSRSMQ